MNYAVREEDDGQQQNDMEEEPQLIAVDEETENLLMRDGQFHQQHALPGTTTNQY